MNKYNLNEIYWVRSGYKEDVCSDPDSTWKFGELKTRPCLITKIFHLGNDTYYKVVLGTSSERKISYSYKHNKKNISFDNNYVLILSEELLSKRITQFVTTIKLTSKNSKQTYKNFLSSLIPYKRTRNTIEDIIANIKSHNKAKVEKLIIDQFMYPKPCDVLKWSVIKAAAVKRKIDISEGIFDEMQFTLLNEELKYYRNIVLSTHCESLTKQQILENIYKNKKAKIPVNIF